MSNLTAHVVDQIDPVVAAKLARITGVNRRPEGVSEAIAAVHNGGLREVDCDGILPDGSACSHATCWD